VDLLCPHHENEIAQSQCCNGTPFSHHWYHSEHLLVDGKKMSKSLGNLYTLDELVAKGFSPMALRYALLMGHPRKQLSFSLDSLHAAESALKTLRTYRAALDGRSRAEATTIFVPIFAALADDLNIPGAFGALFTIVNRGPAGVNLAAFDRVLFALGFQLDALDLPPVEAPAAIVTLAAKRWAAKQSKDFAGADAFRQELTAAGWNMKDAKDSYRLEPLKL